MGYEIIYWTITSVNPATNWAVLSLSLNWPIIKLNSISIFWYWTEPLSFLLYFWLFQMKTESSFCLHHIYVQFINYFQLLKKYILLGLAIFIKFSAKQELVKDTHIPSCSVKLTSQPECTFGLGECYIGICWSLRFKIMCNLI